MTLVTQGQVFWPQKIWLIIVIVSNVILPSFIEIHWTVSVGDHVKVMTFKALWGQKGWVRSTETLQNNVSQYELPSQQIWAHVVMLKFFDLWPNFDLGQPIWFKINRVLSIDHMNSHTKFHENRMKRFWVIVRTDGRTDGQTDGRTDSADILYNLLKRKLIIGIYKKY